MRASRSSATSSSPMRSVGTFRRSCVPQYETHKNAAHQTNEIAARERVAWLTCDAMRCPAEIMSAYCGLVVAPDVCPPRVAGAAACSPLEDVAVPHDGILTNRAPSLGPGFFCHHLCRRRTHRTRSVGNAKCVDSPTGCVRRARSRKCQRPQRKFAGGRTSYEPESVLV